MTERTRLHALTFSTWALGAAVCVHAAPSVAYTTVVLLAAILLVEVHGRATPLGRSFPVLVAVAGVFGVVRVLLTVLTTHGIDDTLFTIPMEFTLPELLGGFTVGGSVEQAVLLRAIAEAYPIVVFVTVFAAWSAVVSHSELLRYVPRAFHEPALAVTIALAFVPTTLRSLRAVQEAELARTGGIRRRRGRVRRTVLPILETGLERAIALSESMDSRGYGHKPPDTVERYTGWMTLVALTAIAGGFVALVSRAGSIALVLAASGTALLLGATAVSSRAIVRTRYRPRALERVDVFVILGVLLAPLGVWIAALADESSLRWQPGRFEWPPVHLGVVLALVALVAPALVRPGSASTPVRGIDLTALGAADSSDEPMDVAWTR
ncbi:MAG: hypothetical protein ACT4OX_11845 [Actinomycetota bacterium]